MCQGCIQLDALPAATAAVAASAAASNVISMQIMPVYGC